MGAKDDISVPGEYRSGQWEYQLIVTAKGSKSQGSRGILLFAGKPVAEPAPGDYYHTPWGDVQWTGNPVVPWGAHGWMLRQSEAQGGRALAEPWIESGQPAVMAMVLESIANTGTSDPVDPWVREAMQKQGVQAFSVSRPWFLLNDQAVVIHDTKMHGSLTARLLPVRSPDKLTVLFGGSETARLDLPRRDGATALAVRKLDGGISDATFYIALRVERAAPQWPAPLEIGPDSNGKQVVVQGVKEVVIGLPGVKNTGLVWSMHPPRGLPSFVLSVQPVGTPQFTPNPGADASGEGIFENVFRVTGTGQTHVMLEYKRPWQKDQAPEKTFEVFFDVK